MALDLAASPSNSMDRANRRNRDLEPNSYTTTTTTTTTAAAAVNQSVEETTKKENGVNSTNSTNGSNKFMSLSHSNSNGISHSTAKGKVRVLGILDGGSNGSNSEHQDSPDNQERTQTTDNSRTPEGSDNPANSDRSESGNDQNKAKKRPTVEREESKHEYFADGLLDGITSSPHRRQKSRSTCKSDQLIADTTVFQSEKNGSKLVSVKAPDNYEEQTKLVKMEEKQKADRHLDSGRQAGKRWQESAIRWAPLNVPLQRRLQTLIVLGHTLCIALSMSTFFFLCAIPLFWPLLIPYMLYCIFSTASTSGTLSHRSDFIRALPVWSLFASYFPARLHRSQALPPTRKYIFGYHPHGIISHGAFAAFATEALGFSQLFPGIKNTLLTLDTNFLIPLYRNYALAMGLASVSKESCENILKKGGPNGEGMGRAITIVVGGARESLDASPRTLRLVLKCRKGFIKLAIRNGADLVPVLSFGENDLYDQFNSGDHPTVHKFQLMVKRCLGFTIPLFHARGVFNYDVGLMPYRRPLNIVVGRPIMVKMDKNPDQQEVDRVHGLYVAELQRLWDTWKDDFAPDREGELVLFE